MALEALGGYRPFGQAETQRQFLTGEEGEAFVKCLLQAMACPQEPQRADEGSTPPFQLTQTTSADGHLFYL